MIFVVTLTTFQLKIGGQSTEEEVKFLTNRLSFLFLVFAITFFVDLHRNGLDFRQITESKHTTS